MKKDIEWLKEQVKGEYEYNREKHNKEGFEGYAHREFVFKYVLGLLDQLDEPEVLSLDWIDDNKKDSGVHYIGYYVPIGRLHDLLVPKQELPVIPQFVADYLGSAKGDITLMRALEIANRRIELPKWKKEYDWISVNDETFARAWLDGFTVEKELLYRLKAGKNYLYFKNDGSVQTVTKKNATINKERLEKLPFDLEQALDSGIVELEELEEC